MTTLLPGDVVIVRTGGFFAWLIRLTERLQGKPDLRNHVAMFHHAADGVNWYLEGRPSGLGWKSYKTGDDAYMGSRLTITNAAQPKTPGQRQSVCMAMRRMFGAPYDWEAIAADAASTLRLPERWEPWGGTMPGHVVCSSSAAWAYGQDGLPAPEVDGGRMTEPADWDRFCETEAWKARPVSM